MLCSVCGVVSAILQPGAIQDFILEMEDFLQGNVCWEYLTAGMLYSYV